jgi:aspartyl-tRNA(Asn)/glutamyl-tRNA(Gln) amidotransferase subunit A
MTPPLTHHQSDAHPHGDIHSTRRAFSEGRATAAEILNHAGGVARTQACAHVFMPGESNFTPQTPAAGSSLPLTGIPFSVKDLFDIAGQTTAAGSTVLVHAAPATADSAAVMRLRQAGATFVGRSNMVEFAFSGVGINPHYGTPVNPADSSVPRVPGGSSSGAAVSVAAGAAMVGLGTDTGGSIRIPAALCGIVGYKSTARLVPLTGALPLSTSLDSVGAVTLSVRDAIIVHEVLAARSVVLQARPLASMRLAVSRTLMQDGLDSTVARAFQRSLQILRGAGAKIEEIGLSEISDLAAINATGGLSAAESYAWHRTLIARHQAEYDPRVATRILRGASMSAADYIELLAARQRWIARMQARLEGFDAVLSPTAPIVAPAIAGLLDDDAEFFRVNGLLLRNTSVVNMLDGCAISLPCQQPGELPVGLMLWHAAMHDDAVLNLALLVEAAFTASLQKQ